MVVWQLEKLRFYVYGKKLYIYTDHQALEPLIKRYRSNKHYADTSSKRNQTQKTVIQTSRRV